jgi:hypothetical protein
MTNLMGAEISFTEMGKEETQRVARADGTRPITSQRFLFHQRRRIEASDQLARKGCRSMLDATRGTRNSTSVNGANSNARGQMRMQQPKQGAPSEKSGSATCKNVPKVCKQGFTSSFQMSKNRCDFCAVLRTKENGRLGSALTAPSRDRCPRAPPTRHIHRK